ncbi:hypothetical protein [Streptomyces sp. NPDC058247]|uniref:hypothetical protein n=1 Tax=Streptomyces sp. NPDC058247 TaxID=3346401 RepID=UPI0036E625D1
MDAYALNIHHEVPDRLGDPVGCGVRRGAEDPDPAGGVFDGGEDVLPQPPQSVHRQVVEQAGEQEPVVRHERRVVDVALQDRELVPQHQDLDLLGALAHRQQAYERERFRNGKVGQAQQHSRPSCQPVLAPDRGPRKRPPITPPTRSDDYSAPAVGGGAEDLRVFVAVAHRK